MKLEQLSFTVTVSSHDKDGEGIRVVVCSLAKRTEVVNIANSVGVELPYSAPYKMIKEKSYPVKPQQVEQFLGVRLGEFVYEPHINIVRNN